MSKIKKFLSCLVCAMMIVGLTKVPVLAAEGTAKGTQKAYVVGDDWGAGVTKTIIDLDKTIRADSVSKTDFLVKETAGTNITDRKVLNAYVSDSQGNEVTTDSKYVTVELYISPSEGNPISWNMDKFQNSWANPYELDVKLAEGENLVASDGTTIVSIEVEPAIDVAGNGKICPQLNGFEKGEFTAANSRKLTYALYSPEKDNHKNALIIWNHGAGENGPDVEIDLLANKVTALAGNEFQNIMDGAYVLVPQRNGTDYAKDAEAVYQLLQKVLAENSDIDADRVIVGGCSQGGGMTMHLVLAHPEAYAAAYPICPAIPSNVTDEQVASLKDLPMWFIHAENDPTVNYEKTTKTFVERLRAAGGEVHTSIFADVHDTSGRFNDENGEPYQYNGHWSWVYFDNNECYDENGVNLWKWMAQQSRIDAVVASGSQKAYVVGDDWGPAVSKTVIKLDKTISTDSVDKNKFNVTEAKTVYDWSNPMAGETYVCEPVARKVINAYTSDATGNKVDKDSNYITIEMYISPNDGSPFVYNLVTGSNAWCDTYKLNVSLISGTTLTAGDEVINTLNVPATINLAGDGKICPQLDKFTMKSYTTSNNTVYQYADYTPAKDNGTNPLVIWLHGAGEGGNSGKNDPSIDVLGNEVTAFVDEEFQSLFKGAYVLAPQCPTMWMDGGDGNYQSGDKGSVYADSLFEMIDAYVKANDDIDPNRVIIGGCSNGGYMTMEMILKHPDYFAAAFPICEAFADEFITDEQIEAIKDLPIWFTYAKNDTTVDPTKHSEPTIARLLAAGAKDVHVSAFEDVHDTTGRFTNDDGTPYSYMGHWSWIYFDNNECYENDLNAWKWLANLVAVPETPALPDKPEKPSDSVDTGDNSTVVAMASTMLLAAGAFIVFKKRA